MLVIIKRPSVQTDLFDIWDFIASDSEARADAFIDALHLKFQSLARKPTIGRMRDGLAKDLRSFPCGHYIIFYLALADGVEIVRVLHSARDLDAVFHCEEE